MEILTPSGYKSIEAIEIGDKIIGQDGQLNTLLNKRTFDLAWFEEIEFGYQWKWFLINGTYRLHHNQNIYVTEGDYNLCHVSELQVGWTIKTETGPVEITSIEEDEVEPIWWKLEVDGDHSFVSQGVHLHNASRYWVGGGASANWNATGNTNWSATSGGSNNASVPTTTDDVFFDGAGTNGNTNSTISTAITVLSFTSTSGYTATITRTGNLTLTAGFTLHKNTQWTGAGALLLNGSMTITANGFSAGDTFWNSAASLLGNATTKTFSSSSGDFKFSSTLTLGNSQTINRTTSETLTIAGGSSISINVVIGGTMKIVLAAGTFAIATSATINAAIDIAGNITFGTGTLVIGGALTYLSGTLTVSGFILLMNAGCTVNTSGVTWEQLRVTATTGTITLLSDLTCSGNFQHNNTTATITINGFTIYVGGNLIAPSLSTGIFTGTTKYVLNGTNPTLSTAAGTTTGGYRNDIELAHSGVCTISGGSISGVSGGFRLIASSGTQVFKLTSGTISNTTRMILAPAAASTTININCNTSGIDLGYLACRTGVATSTYTFDGTNGVTISTLDLQYNGNNNATLTFKNTNTYTISTNFKTDISGLAATNQTTKYTVQSDSAGVKVPLTLSATASQNLFQVNFTDVDASGAQTIFSYGTTLSNTNNILSTPTAPITVIG